MGRSVFIEEIIEERILKLFGETKWASGILIGQVKMANSTFHIFYSL